MTYPILNTEHENKFQELSSKILDLKNLEGPIYSVESKHHFQEIDKKVDSLEEMNYPIRDGVNPFHMYGELQQNLTDIKALAGPVYEVERKHKFSNIEQKLSDIKSIFGP